MTVLITLAPNQVDDAVALARRPMSGTRTGPATTGIRCRAAGRAS